MRAMAIRALFASAVYGFSAGLAHSPGQGARNLLKFPILVFVTAAVCAPAWFLLARSLSREMSLTRLRAGPLLKELVPEGPQRLAAARASAAAIRKASIMTWCLSTESSARNSLG